MKTWLRDFWQAALLKPLAFERIAAYRDAFLRGFIVIVAVALIAALPRAIVGFVDDVRPGREPVEARADAQTALAALRPWLAQAGVPAATLDQVFAQSEANAVLGAALSRQWGDLPTRLPAPLPQLLRGLGGWLATPFSAAPLPLAGAVLATWLGYGIWVMLGAKLLGGGADLPGFFGATAPFALPHLLGVFGLVPVLGPILALIAWAWGLVIYVKATAVSQQISGERALLAVAIPFLLLLSLVLVALASVVLLVVLAQVR